MQVYYRNYGIADTFIGGRKVWIEINRNLLKYPYLHKKTLAHELEHTKSKNKLDIMVELKSLANIKYTFGILWFCIKNPKSLTQLLPIIKSKRGYAVDWLVLALIMGFVGGIAIWQSYL